MINGLGKKLGMPRIKKLRDLKDPLRKKTIEEELEYLAKKMIYQGREYFIKGIENWEKKYPNY